MKTTGLSTDRALRKLYHQLQSIRFHNEIYTKLHLKDYRKFIPIPYPLAYVITIILFAVLAISLSCKTTIYISDANISTNGLLSIIWNATASFLLIFSSCFTIFAGVRRLEGHANFTLVELSKILEDINRMSIITRLVSY